MQRLPILYSFRRCPYAIRARLALAHSAIAVELREVDLKNKPPALLAASPKGTVPVLVLEDQVLEESMDIVYWALSQQQGVGVVSELASVHREMAQALLQQLMSDYLPAMHRFKYPDRFENVDVDASWIVMEHYFQKLEDLLGAGVYLFGELSFVDLAVFPLIRQGAIIDKAQWDALAMPNLKRWYTSISDSAAFQACMRKFQPWQGGEGVVVDFSKPE